MKKIFFLILTILIISCTNKVKEEIAIPTKEKIGNNGLVDTPKERLTNDDRMYPSAAVSENTLAEPENQNMVKDPLYADYQYNFEPLSDDEVLTYSYSYGMRGKEYIFNNEKYKFRLSAKNTITKEERVLGYWNVSGNCQLSRDRKSAIFILDTNDSWIAPRSLFKVDGRTGKVRYLFNKKLSYMSTYNLNYFIFEFDDNGLFVLVDINKNEFVRTIEWRKSDGQWGSGQYRIFRSLDPKYDFRIDFSRESNLEAIAYYNIEHNQLDTIFDVSDADIPYKYAKKREKILPEELGFQAIPDNQ